jgi:hypothetical protein
LIVLQVVSVQELPPVGPLGVQLAAGVGPVRRSGHEVVVKPLPALGAIGEQDATAVGPVVAVLQAVEV